MPAPPSPLGVPTLHGGTLAAVCGMPINLPPPPPAPPALGVPTMLWRTLTAPWAWLHRLHEALQDLHQVLTRPSIPLNPFPRLTRLFLEYGCCLDLWDNQLVMPLPPILPPIQTLCCFAGPCYTICILSVFLEKATVESQTAHGNTHDDELHSQRMPLVMLYC